MKVLLIHNFSRDFNGEDAYFLSQTELLKSFGNKVFTYTKNNKNIKESLLSKISIASGLFVNQNTGKEISLIIQKFRPDVVHVHNVYPLIGASVYQICHKFRTPVVQTIHNYKYFCPKGYLWRDRQVCALCVGKRFPFSGVYYGCYNKSRVSTFIYGLSTLTHQNTLIDRYIFPSEFTRNYYLNHSMIERKKTRVIPYFAKENTLKRVTPDQQKNYFLFAGRLSPEKGIIPLLEVFKSLPKIRLVVVGGGPLKEEVLKYQKYKNITVAGFVPSQKMPDYYRNALFTIIPSLWYEVLPLVLIESLANHTPVIVPHSGAFKSLINDGKSGFYYDKIDELIKLILISTKNINKSLRETMKKYSYHEFQTKYTSKIHYQALMNLYRELV